MTDFTGLVERLRRAVDKPSRHDHDIGDYWNLCDDAIEALTAQAERIAELERDIKHAITMEQFAIDRANKLERDLAATREALTKFGRHDDDFCGIGLPNGECTCGLDAARAKS